MANSNITLRSNLEDYYVHQAVGSIVPIQNATVFKTMNTKQQLDQPIDLFVHPDSVDSKLSTFESSNDHASAVGFVIYDDGVSTSSDYSRFDLYFSHDEQSPTTVATLTFQPIKTTYSQGTKSEQLGTITIFNPFNDKSPRQFDTITLTLADKSQVDITKQAYFADGVESMVLKIGMEDVREAKKDVANYRFDQVEQVTIKYKQ